MAKIVFLVWKKPDYVSLPMVGLAGLLLFAELVRRFLTVESFAFAGGYEAMLVFCGLFCLGYLVLVLTGAFQQLFMQRLSMLVLIALSLGFSASPFFSDVLEIPRVEVRSLWHNAWVLAGTTAMYCFVLSAFLLLTAKSTGEEDRQRKLEKMANRVMYVGFPLFTIAALVCLPLWKMFLTGSWWTWDSRELFVSVLWLFSGVYVIVTGMVRAPGWLLLVSGTLAALMSYLILGGIYQFFPGAALLP